jgi:hypothetical protein
MGEPERLCVVAYLFPADSAEEQIAEVRDSSGWEPGERARAGRHVLQWFWRSRNAGGDPPGEPEAFSFEVSPDRLRDHLAANERLGLVRTGQEALDSGLHRVTWHSVRLRELMPWAQPGFAAA